MHDISVALAVFNEEKNIKKCLESVSGLASEIVVVDGGSTDNTRKIAEKFQARILGTNNPRIFHINKQKALEMATRKWILQLDADEVISEELKKEIIDLIDDGSIDGYYIPRKNYFLGSFLTKGGQYPDYTLRLYRNGKAKFPCKSVHEQVTLNGNSTYLKHPLLHFSYQNFSHYLDHFNLYTSIFADELKSNNLQFNSWTFLSYILWQPLIWFIKTFIRHKGYKDGFPGFVFSLFSSLRFPTAYIKYWETGKAGRR